METQNSPLSILRKAALISGISLILGLFFDYFFYGKIPGISFPAYVLLIIFGLYFLSAFLGKQFTKEALWLLVPLAFFSVMVFARASIFLTILNIIASLLLLLAVAALAFRNSLRNYFIADYLKILFLPFNFIRPLFQTLSDIFSSHCESENKSKLFQVIKGIAISVPVLIIFLFLFSSADLVFEKFVTDIISITIKPETVFRALLIFIATLIFIGAYSYAFKPREDGVKNSSNVSRLGHIEAYILLGSVNLLFLAFIIVQFAYLFGGESNISFEGFTYAEYARKGFFELIAVAGILLLMLLAADKYISRSGNAHFAWFKALSTLLVVQVVVIMASAFIRLSLYEDAYGFTVLRLYSHAFIIFLSIVFLALLFKIFIDTRENAFSFRVYIIAFLFLAGMNIFNPDVFIARKNIARYASSGELDIYYLNEISDDAIFDVVGVLNMPDEDLRNSFARELYWKSQRMRSSPYSKWQSLNLSRMKAEKALDSRLPELEPYKDYVSTANKVQ